MDSARLRSRGTTPRSSPANGMHACCSRDRECRVHPFGGMSSRYEHQGSHPRYVTGQQHQAAAARRGAAMTADRVAAGKSGARASGRGSARAGTAERLSRADRVARVARGKDARAAAPLGSHAEFRPGTSRDPVGLLLGQAQSRVPELVPVRHGRMLVSPFTFYRGAALPMAADLAGTPAIACRLTCVLCLRRPWLASRSVSSGLLAGLADVATCSWPAVL